MPPLLVTISPMSHHSFLRLSTFGDGGDLSAPFDGELKVGMCTIFAPQKPHSGGLYLFKSHFFPGSQHSMLQHHRGFGNGEG